MLFLFLVYFNVNYSVAFTLEALYPVITKDMIDLLSLFF